MLVASFVVAILNFGSSHDVPVLIYPESHAQSQVPAVVYDACSGKVFVHGSHEALPFQSDSKPVMYCVVPAGHVVSNCVPLNVFLHILLLVDEPGCIVFGNAVGGI